MRTPRPRHPDDSVGDAFSYLAIGLRRRWWVAAFVLCAGCSSSTLPGAGADAGALADLAASFDASAARGVPCGARLCDTPAGNVCCERAMPACTPPPCAPGVQSDACDGPEDCRGSEVCCLLVAPFGTACTASCGQTGDQRGRVCHSHLDCAGGEICCPLETAGGLRGCVVGAPDPQCT